MALIKLPPQTTHLQQPLNVGVFKNVESEWYQKFDEFFRTTGINFIDKNHF